MTTSRKFPQRRRKYLRLQADTRLEYNRADFPLLAHLQGLYIFLFEHGLIFDQELNSIKRTQWQKEQTLLRQGESLRGEDGAIEFWRFKMIFGLNLSTLTIGLIMYGRTRWQEAKATRTIFNIVLIRQDKKFLTSELFKVIQDAIPLILHCRTMS